MTNSLEEYCGIFKPFVDICTFFVLVKKTNNFIYLNFLNELYEKSSVGYYTDSVN